MIKKFIGLFILLFMFTLTPASANGLSVLVTDAAVSVVSLDATAETLTAQDRRFNVTGGDHALITKDTNSFIPNNDGWEGFGKVTDNATVAPQGNINLPYEVGWRSS